MISSYWMESIPEILSEVGIDFTQDQAKQVAEYVDSASSVQGESSGSDIASHNHVPDSEVELKKLRSEISEQENWIATTDPCTECCQTGVVDIGWGREGRCESCRGEGRK